MTQSICNDRLTIEDCEISIERLKALPFDQAIQLFTQLADTMRHVESLKAEIDFLDGELLKRNKEPK